MGRDLIARIPEFADQMENLRDKVLAYAEDVTHNLEQLRVTDTTGDTSESNKEVILYSGNNPKALLHPGKGNKDLPQTLQTPADEMNLFLISTNTVII